MSSSLYMSRSIHHGDLTAVLQILCLSFTGNFLSRITAVTCLHLFHATLTLFLRAAVLSCAYFLQQSDAILILVLGAGAVVTLMIGTVVEKVSCAEYLPTGDNSTVSTALFDSELQCRVGIATAVTFLSAMFQVCTLQFHFHFSRLFQSVVLRGNHRMSASIGWQIKFLLVWNLE